MGIGTTFLHAQSEQNQLQAAVSEYVQGADERDLTKLEEIFDPNFRAVINTPEGIWVSDKSAYLQMIKEEKIGGDTRQVEFGKIIFVDDLNATVEVILNGEQAVFHNLISLGKSKNKWLVLQDLVQYTPKE